MLSALLIAVLMQTSVVNGPDLLTTSGRVANAAGWEGYMYGYPCYEWVSDHELIFYTKKPSRRDMAWWVYLLDVRTGKSKSLQPLTDLYNKEMAGVGGLHPSPDRRYFWARRGGDPQQFYVTDIMGKEVSAWPIRRTGSRWNPTAQTNLIWNPDSRSLIESVMDYTEAGIRITAWQRDIGSLDEPELLGASTLNDPWLYAVWPSLASDGRYFQILHDRGNDDYRKNRILTWSQTVPDSEGHVDVTFPGVEISHYEPSPDGMRILWETTTAPRGTGSWIYEDADSPDRPPGPHYVRLWLSGRDGTNKRLLGSVELKDGKKRVDSGTFGWMRWLPDGKRVSFLFRHKLYVLDL